MKLIKDTGLRNKDVYPVYMPVAIFFYKCAWYWAGTISYDNNLNSIFGIQKKYSVRGVHGTT